MKAKICHLKVPSCTSSVELLQTMWPVLFPLSSTSDEDTHAKDVTGKVSCTPWSLQNSCHQPDCLKQGMIFFTLLPS